MTAEQVATAQAQAAAWRPAGALVRAMTDLFMLGLEEDLLPKLKEKTERFARELKKLWGGGAAPTVSLKPKCAAPPKETPRWKDVANKPGCRVWVNYYVPGQAVTCPAHAPAASQTDRALQIL